MSIQKKIIKGKEYEYIEKSVRHRNKIIKYSKIKNGDKVDIDEKLAGKISRYYKKSEYPLTEEEIKKIELMNFSYKKIRQKLDKKDWEDVKKRFVANFVFESNALEGNSLTLKNFSDIIFEDKVSKSTDLREVYDAKNSFEVFSYLFKARKNITKEFILEIHKKVMKDIDSRIGFKKIPNILLGRKIKLVNPKDVEKEIDNLILWYNGNRYDFHPLELALKFHHKFEVIHPFSDGNGRVGRMLLNYILIKEGYFPIIIRKNQRDKYLKSLYSADLDKYIVLMRFGIDRAKETFRKFFKVYFEYL